MPAKVRFLSVEPLIGPVPKLPLKGIHWVIVDGEFRPAAFGVTIGARQGNGFIGVGTDGFQYIFQRMQ